MSTAQTSHVLPTYARVDLAFARGEGVWLTATNGERYLDFSSGVAVNALGHNHPRLVAALTEHLNNGVPIHVSNLYRIPEAERLAARLCQASFADVVFFCNSGAPKVNATAFRCAGATRPQINSRSSSLSPLESVLRLLRPTPALM